MARVTAPLFALRASGRIGDHLAFRRSRGLQVAQQLSSPTGPPSSAQEQARSFYSAGAAAWHDHRADADSVLAWQNFARIYRPGLSGFNAYLGEYLAARHAGNSWANLVVRSLAEEAPGWAVLRIYQSGLPNNATAYFSTSPFSGWIQVAPLTPEADVYVGSHFFGDGAGLTYAYADWPSTPGTLGRTGLSTLTL